MQMKTFITILFLLSLSGVSGQQDAYLQAMQRAMDKLNQASAPAEFQDAANLFERIAQAEKNEWLPLYHAAYACIVTGFTEPDNSRKDGYFDKAQQFLDRAFKIAPEESELYTLQAFLYPGKITVDPMGRGPELFGPMNDAIDKAIRLNPENPRSYYLRAITLLNMPESFGGGKAAAKPWFDKAKERFDRFKPASPFSPDWGKQQNEEELSKL
jgi:tetratricopeptide (TPR) repeat protein